MDTEQEFNKMTGKESLSKETRNNVINQALAEGADFLGVSEASIVGGIGVGVVGLSTYGVYKASTKSTKKSINSNH